MAGYKHKVGDIKLRNKNITNYVRSTHATRSQPQNTKFNSPSKSVRFSHDISKPKTYKNLLTSRNSKGD